MSSIRYEFIMSQVENIRDIKENEKIKISLVFYEGCQAPCVLKECKGRDLSNVYQALMEVRHPNLAIVYDCVYEAGNTYVIEEYIPGKTIAELLEEKGTFAEQETVRIIKELCDGLECLHQLVPPIIHNDIKTSNIMLREDGSVKLFDFDISRIYKEGSYKNTKLMGTYEYAAPEHYGFGQSEPCTDIYSLGVTMHEMLTGVGLNQEHNVTYEGSLRNILQKCVEIDRKKRYASAALLKADLEKMQKRSTFAWKNVLFVLGVVLLLTLGGLCLHTVIENAKEPQGNIGTEDEILKDNLPTEETEGGEEANEVVGETESEEMTEDEIMEAPQENSSKEDEIMEVPKENDSKEDDSQEDSSNGDNNSEVVESSPSIPPSNSIETPKKAAKTVYKIQDTFLAMDAWNDGTFLLMEEMSGKYYLRTSDGKEKQMEGVRAAYGAQLECNPYTDQMYLMVFDYSEQFVYSVTKELEVEFIKKYDVDGKTGAFIAFLSDGTLLYDWERLNCTDWSSSCKDGIVSSPEPNMIKDTIYSFEFIVSDSGLLYRFLERNAEGKVVKEFPLEDEGIRYTSNASGTWHGVYNNSLGVYFKGNKSGKDYIYYFDGETFNVITCLNEYDGYRGYSYKELCVTATAARYYDTNNKTVIEIPLE